MNNKVILLLIILALVVTTTACGKNAETTLSGIVVSVDGNTVSLMQFDTDMQNGQMPADGESPGRPNGEWPNGERPNRERPDGKRPNPEDFQGFEGFEGVEGFENFDPENFNPEDFNGKMPKLPEAGNFPNLPADGERPDFSSRFPRGETKTIDLTDAHISVEIDGGKATGSMEDISVGSFITVTIDTKGEATNVLVSSMPRFGGMRFSE